MARSGQDRARRQRELRRRRNERAYIFDGDLSRCLGEVERERWEFAIELSGGEVVAAARRCGLADVPPGAKALWGRSAEAAVGTYRSWLNRRRKK